MKGRDTILSIRDLEVTFKVRDRQLKAIRRISFDLYRGETLAIVGESGSGKSVLMKSLTGMLESNGVMPARPCAARRGRRLGRKPAGRRHRPRAGQGQLRTG